MCVYIHILLPYILKTIHIFIDRNANRVTQKLKISICGAGKRSPWVKAPAAQAWVSEFWAPTPHKIKMCLEPSALSSQPVQPPGPRGDSISQKQDGTQEEDSQYPPLASGHMSYMYTYTLHMHKVSISGATWHLCYFSASVLTLFLYITNGIILF